jgi:Domain of unknown function (DUF4410)
MKYSKKRIVGIIAICIVVCISGFAQNAKLKIEKGKYQKIKIARFDIKQGIDNFAEKSLSIMMVEIAEELKKIFRFRKVFLEPGTDITGIKSPTDFVDRVIQDDKRLLKKIFKPKDSTGKESDAQASNSIADNQVAKMVAEPEIPGTIDPLADSTIRLIGTVTKFDEGNKAVRWVIGTGAGRAKLLAHIKFIDLNNNVLFEKDVDGKVTMGTFGGDPLGATRGLAKEIAKVAAKQFF